MLSTRKCFWFVHDTADGMVHSKVERQRRKWIARHWGDQLDGMRVCASLRDANKSLVYVIPGDVSGTSLYRAVRAVSLRFAIEEETENGFTNNT